jgi:hypothetical protein
VNRNSAVVAAARQLSHRRIETQASVRPEPRPNADSTISLLTLGTASFLYIADRTTLERKGLAASRRLESCMQSLEMT